MTSQSEFAPLPHNMQIRILELEAALSYAASRLYICADDRTLKGIECSAWAEDAIEALNGRLDKFLADEAGASTGRFFRSILEEACTSGVRGGPIVFWRELLKQIVAGMQRSQMWGDDSREDNEQIAAWVGDLNAMLERFDAGRADGGANIITTHSNIAGQNNDPREAWKAAKAEVEAVEKERNALLAPTKERYDAAQAEVKAIEKERAELLVPTKERYYEAQCRLELIEESLPELISRCEGCDGPILKGDRYNFDIQSCIYLCEPCAPSWGDMLANPDHFYNDEGKDHTAETAKAAVDAHLAIGGSLEDKMVW